MEKYKKANELEKTLEIGKKLAKIPLREFVASQICKQETRIGEPECFHVAKNYVFERLKTQRILSVDRNFVLRIIKLFQSKTNDFNKKTQ